MNSILHFILLYANKISTINECARLEHQELHLNDRIRTSLGTSTEGSSDSERRYAIHNSLVKHLNDNQSLMNKNSSLQYLTCFHVKDNLNISKNQNVKNQNDFDLNLTKTKQAFNSLERIYHTIQQDYNEPLVDNTVKQQFDFKTKNKNSKKKVKREQNPQDKIKENANGNQQSKLETEALFISTDLSNKQETNLKKAHLIDTPHASYANSPENNLQKDLQRDSNHDLTDQKNQLQANDTNPRLEIDTNYSDNIKSEILENENISMQEKQQEMALINKNNMDMGEEIDRKECDLKFQQIDDFEIIRKKTENTLRILSNDEIEIWKQLKENNIETISNKKTGEYPILNKELETQIKCDLTDDMSEEIVEKQETALLREFETPKNEFTNKLKVELKDDCLSEENDFLTQSNSDDSVDDLKRWKRIFQNRTQIVLNDQQIDTKTCLKEKKYCYNATDNFKNKLIDRYGKISHKHIDDFVTHVGKFLIKCQDVCKRKQKLINGHLLNHIYTHEIRNIENLFWMITVHYKKIICSFLEMIRVYGIVEMVEFIYYLRESLTPLSHKIAIYENSDIPRDRKAEIRRTRYIHRFILTYKFDLETKRLELNRCHCNEKNECLYCVIFENFKSICSNYVDIEGNLLRTNFLLRNGIVSEIIVFFDDLFDEFYSEIGIHPSENPFK